MILAAYREPWNFKKTYEEKMKDKHIYIMIHQPKIL